MKVRIFASQFTRRCTHVNGGTKYTRLKSKYIYSNILTMASCIVISMVTTMNQKVSIAIRFTWSEVAATCEHQCVGMWMGDSLHFFTIPVYTRNDFAHSHDQLTISFPPPEKNTKTEVTKCALCVWLKVYFECHCCSKKATDSTPPQKSGTEPDTWCQKVSSFGNCYS